jgi:serine/threonine-protein kinase RsbT
MKRQEYSIHDEASFQRALLQIKSLATGFGYNEIQTAKFLTMASELGRNILKYAVKGQLIIVSISAQGRSGLELVAQDKGPGIPNINTAMQENFSTGGSLGQGLPGARRLVDEFSIQSKVNQGTHVRTVLWK